MKANPATPQTSGQRPTRPMRPRRVADARAPAPSDARGPHAAICHGVHGPWPKKKFEVSPATAPTTKPGAPPSA